jgi:hypothetical protein
MNKTAHLKPPWQEVPGAFVGLGGGDSPHCALRSG